MKKLSARIFVTFVIVLFVNFMFSNSIFTHVHKGLDGKPVTHSHPYLPSSGHGHTGHSFDLIAGFNAAAVAVQGSGEAIVSVPDQICIHIRLCVSAGVKPVRVPALSLRAPPCLVA